MPNGTWKRSTTNDRRAGRQLRYAHVSVAVGVSKDEATGMLTPTRTPKGQGSTATRLTPKQGARKVKGHDWPGRYIGKLASVEAEARFRRADNIRTREEMRRADYFTSRTFEEALQT